MHRGQRWVLLAKMGTADDVQALCEVGYVAGGDVQCLGSVESNLVVGCFCGIERVLSVRSTWL